MTSSSLTLGMPKHWRRTSLPTTTCSTWWSCWQDCCWWCCRCAKLPLCPHCDWMSTWVNIHTPTRELRHMVCYEGVYATPVGPRHSWAAGFGCGSIWAMHETSMVGLPHLHPTQENHGEGKTIKTGPFWRTINNNFAKTQTYTLHFSLLFEGMCPTAAVCGGHSGSDQTNISHASDQSSETNLPGRL